jgi:hypothetical protein
MTRSRPVVLGEKAMKGRKTVQWLVLLAVTVILTAALRSFDLPGALLLGPMFAGIAVALGGASIRLKRAPYIVAQAVLGCLIAHTATPSSLSTLALDWHLFLGITLSSIFLCAAMGWLLCRLGVMPGTTAIWGTSPGGAAAMVVMGDAYGADARLVAFMQYSRVICVALAATLVARIWTDAGGMALAATVWFPPLNRDAAVTLGLIALGSAAGFWGRLPSGAMLVPMLVGAALRLAGLVDFQLPPWLLAASYAVIGWRTGLGFTRQVIAYVAKAMPLILATILTLIALGGGLSWVLARLTGVDALTAYLATSPGGADTVAIIAAGCPAVDLPFVMALQTLRLFMVILISQPLARFLANKATGNPAVPPM